MLKRSAVTRGWIGVAVLDGLRSRQHTRRALPDPVMTSIDITIRDRGGEATLRSTLASDDPRHTDQNCGTCRYCNHDLRAYGLE